MKPQIIVLTPVRNEAWVLRAFLAATSLWADKIIIADQMSTDGSREIYKEFQLSLPLSLSSHKCELIVINNDRKEMHQAATRRLLFDKAREVLNGDTNAILFALDADEFLSGDFVHTEDWKRIMNSEPDDAFCWRWMNLKEGDITQYCPDAPYFYWAVHVSESLWEGEFPDNFIHEWRLPWPPQCTKEKEFKMDDFSSIHFARINTKRQKNKWRFYWASSIANKPTWNRWALYRQYNSEEVQNYKDVPSHLYDYYLQNNVDTLSLVDLDDCGQYYSDEVIKYMNRGGVRPYLWTGIWDEEWCKQNGIQDPQKWIHKMWLAYMRWSQVHRNIVVRIVDKIMMKL